MDELKNLTLISKSEHKEPGSSISFAEYAGAKVVVKQGGSEVFREAEVLKQINSPLIPKVVGYIERNDSSFLILEHLRGKPLVEVINFGEEWQSTPLAKNEAIDLIQRVALSFRAVQDAGFYYRDLNLAHILVDDYSVNLVDHEANVRIDKAGEAVVDSLTGTWETMSPEEYEVGGKMTGASNVYTLGTVLHQLIIGFSPFYIRPEEIEDPVRRRSATKNKMKEFGGVATGDESLDDIINKSLSFDPSKRFVSIDELIMALTG